MCMRVRLCVRVCIQAQPVFVCACEKTPTIQ